MPLHLISNSSLDFLKQVFAGEKNLLEKSEVNEISVPEYEELSVRRIWPEFAKDAAKLQYFPDRFAKGKKPPRKYFFNVLNTIHPEYL